MSVPERERRSLCPRGGGARERGKMPHHSPSARPTPGRPTGLGVRPLSLLDLPFPRLPSLSRVDLRAPLRAPCTAHDPPAALSRLPPLDGQPSRQGLCTKESNQQTPPSGSELSGFISPSHLTPHHIPGWRTAFRGIFQGLWPWNCASIRTFRSSCARAAAEHLKCG